MIKVRSVYHTPRGERGIGKAIVAWTWLLGLFYNWRVLKYNYSHEETWISDEKGEFGGAILIGLYRENNAHQILFKGHCFSSTTRGDANGVRFAPANEVLAKHPGRWEYIEFEVDEAYLEVAIEEAWQLVGKEYDFLGILGFVQPFAVQDKDKWWCSEICDWFKRLCRIFLKRHKRISPRRSAYILAKKWGEPKPLT